MRRNLIASLLLSAITCLAQERPVSEEELSRLADELTALQDEDADYESLYENLLQTMSAPIDLNKASAEELGELHILSPKQVDALIRYRTTYGPLASIYELQAIAELDLATIQRLLPRVMVTDPQSIIGRSLWQRALFEQNHYLITRYERTLEKKDGYRARDATSKFKGSPGKFYTRFRSGISGDYSVGFTAEKDAGEQFRWNGAVRQYGFDFLSCHAQIRNKGRLKNLVIGDYQCQFGQGLLLGGAFGLGKGAETVATARKTNVGLMPYTSVNESGFFRGVATTLQLSRHLDITGLYSAMRRDGADQSDSTGNITISSLQSTGLHRSEDELKDRKTVLEKNYAAVLSYRGANLDAGVIFHGIHFSDAVQRNPSAYNQFAFRGKTNMSVSTFVNYTHNNFNFFSEAARSQNGGTAVLMGMLASLHPKFDLSLVFRKYGTHYHSFYANAFAESTQAQNETGLYWGWKYTWSRRYNLCGYMDLFRFPWLGFRRYAPAYGHEWLLKFNYQPGRKTVMFVQVREEKKARNHGEAGNLYLTDHGIRRNYWVVLNYSVAEKLTLRTRAQFNTYALQGSTTKGLVLLQDVSYGLGRFKCSARHAVFETDDYENRNYVYENDAWMAFSLPAYDGIGLRNYVLLQYKVNKMISLWIRYARTRYIDRTETGSGADRIAGNTRKDVKFQALIRF
jgi:hypothetical protein